MSRTATRNQTEIHPAGKSEKLRPAQPLAEHPFSELDDQEWGLIADLYQIDEGQIPQRGRPRANPRAMVNASLWILLTGNGWLTLPAQYPSPTTCRRRFELWLTDGTWQEMARRLASSGRITAGAKALAVPQKLARATFFSALLR